MAGRTASKFTYEHEFDDNIAFHQSHVKNVPTIIMPLSWMIFHTTTIGFGFVGLCYYMPEFFIFHYAFLALLFEHW